jgi:hypothetical protein
MAAPRVEDDRRGVAGGRERDLARGLDLGVGERGVAGGAHLLDEGVEVSEHGGGCEAGGGQRADGAAELSHRGGGEQPTTDHVTDRDADPPGREPEGVVPVAADLQILDRGVVIGRHLEPGVHERISGEQAALQRHGDVRRALVEPCALQRETRLGRAGGEEVALFALPSKRPVEAEQQATGRAEREPDRRDPALVERRPESSSASSATTPRRATTSSP